MSRSSIPLIHLVCGSTGAGKTTYAIALTESLRGVRFSIDEWMAALFWMDATQPIECRLGNGAGRARHGADLAHGVAGGVARSTLCARSGAWPTHHIAINWQSSRKDAGHSLQLHFLDVPAAERWRRVQSRNREKSLTAQLPFDVTREMFDFVEGIFEPPDAAELAARNGLVIRGQ